MVYRVIRKCKRKVKTNALKVKNITKYINI